MKRKASLVNEKRGISSSFNSPVSCDHAQLEYRLEAEAWSSIVFGGDERHRLAKG